VPNDGKHFERFIKDELSGHGWLVVRLQDARSCGGGGASQPCDFVVLHPEKGMLEVKDVQHLSVTSFRPSQLKAMLACKQKGVPYVVVARVDGRINILNGHFIAEQAAQGITKIDVMQNVREVGETIALLERAFRCAKQ
jgi:Holliday junction resolvase